MTGVKVIVLHTFVQIRPRDEWDTSELALRKQPGWKIWDDPSRSVDYW